MATIKISNLYPAGTELFVDCESYLNELTIEELSLTQGGSTPLCGAAATAVISVTGIATGVAAWGYHVGRDARRRQEHRAGNACYA